MYTSGSHFPAAAARGMTALRMNPVKFQSRNGLLRIRVFISGAGADSIYNDVMRPPVEWPISTMSVTLSRRMRDMAESMSAKYSAMSRTSYRCWPGRSERPYLRRSTA